MLIVGNVCGGFWGGVWGFWDVDCFVVRCSGVWAEVFLCGVDFFVGINVWLRLYEKKRCVKRGVKCCRVALLKRRIMYIMYSLVCCGTRKHVYNIHCVCCLVVLWRM